ncbi:hypothetical protein GAY29_16615 [Azospirillum brasilense]|uniref:hypothetical protein n=1 Tax=Azospirillum brasilense TaxID=192 RepID=UPI001909AD62|nr:hypothetical protein [Azospirillum brasilense]MBK3734694.1 hypothetical protein [Azospirillum brasilense]
MAHFLPRAACELSLMNVIMYDTSLQMIDDILPNHMRHAVGEAPKVECCDVGSHVVGIQEDAVFYIDHTDDNMAARSLLAALHDSEDISGSRFLELVAKWAFEDPELIREGLAVLADTLPANFLTKLNLQEDNISALSRRNIRDFWINFSVSLERRMLLVKLCESENSGNSVPDLSKVIFERDDGFIRKINCVEGWLSAAWFEDLSISVLAKAALDKTVAQIKEIPAQNFCGDRALPPSTRAQILAFDIQTGHPPPVSIAEVTFSHPSGRRVKTDHSRYGGLHGYSFLCGQPPRTPVPDGRMSGHWRRSPCSYPAGTRPIERRFAFAGTKTTALAAPFEGPSRAQSFPYPRQGRDMDQLCLAASRLFGGTNRMNLGRAA